MNIFTVKTISNSFKYLLLAWSLLLPAAATEMPFADWCHALAGNWQGSGARSGELPKAITTQAICSADGAQLIISVSQGVRYASSETWWFRRQGDKVMLTFFDGVTEDKGREFSLYRRGDSYSLLGEGVITDRPALIQLLFEPKDGGWQWLQQSQFLDDEVERYQLYRGMSLLPLNGGG
ncbi:hypothetical protein [Shewanella jiangmenensis]|nr:hypothetical protein [Shewanella jiangmenensis]